MLVLKVSNNCGDFGAMQFEEAHGGKLAGEIIADMLADSDAHESDDWQLSLHEFKDIDPAFVKFVKERIMDYDDSKNTNFYLETEKIGG